MRIAERSAQNVADSAGVTPSSSQKRVGQSGCCRSAPVPVLSSIGHEDVCATNLIYEHFSLRFSQKCRGATSGPVWAEFPNDSSAQRTQRTSPKKAQDRDDGRLSANNSVLKIRMKNAVLRRQDALSAQPAPKRRARQASAACVLLHGGKRREQQQPKL